MGSCSSKTKVEEMSKPCITKQAYATTQFIKLMDSVIITNPDTRK